MIFDEFHERALQADLGLAFALEARAALRPDLRLLVMSATLDAEPVAALMGGAPVVTAEGRAYPVDTRWLERPWRGSGDRLEAAVAALVLEALAVSEGGVLVFLPGQGEIARTAAALAPRLPEGVTLRPLHGGLPFAEQRAALVPAATWRRVVLATSIAETSLTIPDVRVVVDAGLARRARFDPGSGMTRLVTERVTRAEAEQRRGRAGRLAPGWCFRLWTRGEEGALAAFPPPEIATADLAPLALELALWGSAEGLAFLTPPPAPALAEARALLADLEALDAEGRITARGRELAAMPTHPRLAHMLVEAAGHGAGRLAADLAALVAARDPVSGPGGPPPADLALRLAALRDPGRVEAEAPVRVDRGAVAAIRAEAARLARLVRGRAGAGLAPGAVLSLAYPDRIGQRRAGAAARYLLSGGKGAVLAEADPLGTAPLSRGGRSRRRPARGAHPAGIAGDRSRPAGAAWRPAATGDLLRLVAARPGGAGARAGDAGGAGAGGPALARRAGGGGGGGALRGHSRAGAGGSALDARGAAVRGTGRVAAGAWRAGAAGSLGRGVAGGAGGLAGAASGRDDAGR